MGKRIVLAFLVLLTGIFSTVAQQEKKLYINEVLIINQNQNADEYGMHSPWIELYNSSDEAIDAGGFYLTNDSKNLTKYQIPTGDVLTKIQPKQHLVFFADSMPLRGLLHLSFTLSDIGGNNLYLVANDGVSVVDSVSITSVTKDVSWARETDGGSKWAFASVVTPNEANNVSAEGAKPESSENNSGEGSVISEKAMTVVLIVFGLIVVFFVVFGRNKKEKPENKTEEKSDEPVAEKVNTNNAVVTDEVFAAISMAIYQLQDHAHDHENTVLTIDKSAHLYSPWSSKIHGLRQIPVKK
jgi:Na+-transporting methylmalonyl-CoA/oxaloacetate decarboxylase gamma subunit